jgi:hypothetical protein
MEHGAQSDAIVSVALDRDPEHCTAIPHDTFIVGQQHPTTRALTTSICTSERFDAAVFSGRRVGGIVFTLDKAPLR